MKYRDYRVYNKSLTPVPPRHGIIAGDIVCAPDGKLMTVYEVVGNVLRVTDSGWFGTVEASAVRPLR
jgi:hypothetical protein